MLVAAVSAAHIVIPAIMLFWSISGLFSMTIGICAESAPLFYCVTLAAMLAQVAAMANVAKINVSSHRGDELPSIRYYTSSSARWRPPDTMCVILNPQCKNAHQR